MLTAAGAGGLAAAWNISNLLNVARITYTWCFFLNLRDIALPLATVSS